LNLSTNQDQRIRINESGLDQATKSNLPVKGVYAETAMLLLMLTSGGLGSAGLLFVPALETHVTVVTPISTFEVA